MNRAAFCLPFAFLFIANYVIPSGAQSAEPASAAPAAAPAPPPAAADALPEVVFDVRSNISLLCQLPYDENLGYVWKKNGTEISQVWEMTARYTAGGSEFHVARALEDDFGNYSCAVGSAEQHWAVRGRPHLKLPANTNVVEGQKLKLTCRVVGKPYPRVEWSYSNGTEGAAFEPARGTLEPSEQGVPDGVLSVAAAARSDAGTYRCSAPGAAPALTTLRVKDMYAALWPFLGICAEVFVLCAIILLYERRRTKPDLDDSDADNHDQKKT